MNDYLDREFPMSKGNFSTIQKVAYKLTGIQLGEHKKNMVYSRLSRRLRSLNLKAFDSYCDILSADAHSEHGEFINAITTNLTSFFRENHHFEYLKDTALPEIIRKHHLDKRIRIWSAGCSVGEEPYSIAMIVKEKVNPGWDVKLLATDLDTNVVAHGKAGVYEVDRIESVSNERKKKWFSHSSDGSSVKVKSSLRDLITFKQLNLLESWPIKGPFDVIFCRNVVIYFDKETQKKLFDRYAELLAPGGYLFIGHSESLHRVSDRFKSLGKTMYQKIR